MRRFLPYAWILAAVAIVGATYVLPGVERAMFRDFADDAFFYVDVARNVVAGRGLTSDGFGLTNGYHPAWMLLHVAVAEVFPDPRSALVALQLAILAVALCLLYRFLEGRVGPVAALLAALLASFEVSWTRVLDSGMETGLALVALLALLLLLRDFAWKDRRPLALQASLALLFFARLDGALFWIALAAIGLAEEPSRRRIASLVRLFAPPALLAGTYLAANALVFGSAMPISGRIKAIGLRDAIDGGAGAYLAGVFDRLVLLFAVPTTPLPFGISAYFPRRGVLDAAFWTVYLVLVGFAVVHVARRIRRDLPVRLLLAGTALHAAYYALLQKDRYSLSWARGPELLLLTLVAAWLGSRVVAGFPWRRFRIALAFAVVFVALCATSLSRARHPGTIRDFNTSVSAFRDGVRWVRDHTGPDEAVASESLGFLGFYADRRVVSLDGLLNSIDFYRRYLRAGRVGDYLREHHVRYVAEGLRKDVDPVAYLSAVLGVPPSELRVEASFDGPDAIPRRYVVVRFLGADAPESRRAAS